MAKSPKEIKDYIFENNTYKSKVKDDVKDLLEIEIGDSKQPDFKPQFKLIRWNNEVNFSMRAEEQLDAVVEVDGEKIKYKTKDYEVHQYDKPEAGEDGGFEFEWILPKKPKTNVLTATIETKGLDFFYQPELTQEEVDSGDIRPENVIGSYAVYHSTKRHGAYKTGKAFHIYRPKAIDARGDWTWCDLNIDTDNKLLTVTVDDSWLNKAKYPVVVDPTLGYTSIGGSSSTIADNEYSGPSVYERRMGTVFSIPENGTLSTFHIYSPDNSLGFISDFTLKGVVSEKDSVATGQHGQLAITSPFSVTADLGDWVSESISGSLVAGTDYIINAFADGDSGGLAEALYLPYDTGSSTYYYEDHTYASPESPWVVSSGSNRQYSLYVTYTTKTHTLTDNFNDNSIGAEWDTDSSYTTVEETGGKASITVGTYAGDYGYYYSVDNYDATDSYVLSEVSPANTSTAFTEIIMQIDSDNLVAMSISGGNLQAYQKVGGSFSSLQTATYNATNHKWWRIRGSGGQVYWDYSADGQVWINFHHVSNPITMTAVSVRFGVYANSATSSDNTATFDNFNIGVDGDDIDTISDDFDDNSINSSLWNEYETGSGTVTETGQLLEFSLANSTVGSWAGLCSVKQYDLTGKRVFVKVPDATGGGAWLDLTLSMEQLPVVDNFFSIGIDTDSGEIEAVLEHGGSDSVLYSTTYNSSTHAYIALRESSGTIYWEYASEAEFAVGTWNTLYSSSSDVPFPVTNLYIVLDDYEHASSTGNTHQFDDFNIAPSSDFLTGWTYRKELNLSPSSDGTLTNYQKKITVHYGSGSDSGVDVYCSSNCKTDFGDIRFTTSDNTELDYYMVQKTDSDKAVFYVEFDSIDASAGFSGYIYYGNSGASTTSNGTNTFNHFEDFEGTPYLFDTAGSSGITFAEETTEVKEGSKSAVTNNGSLGYRISMQNDTSYDIDDYILEGWLLIGPDAGTSENFGPGLHVAGSSGSNNGYQAIIDERSAQSPQIRENTSSTGRTNGSYQVADETWYLLNIYRDNGSDVKSEIYTEAATYTITPTSTTTRSSETTYNSGYTGVFSYSTTNSYFDATWVRKRTENEPAYGTWGSEEESGATPAARRVFNVG